MHFAALLLVASTLVLRTGQRIAIEGPPTEQDGVVVFRSAGALYSLPAFEIDEVATTAANVAAAEPPAARALKVSPAERERLLRELEKNHSGQPPAEPRWQAASASPVRNELANEDEWNWRQRSRAYEEGVRQAKENLNLLLDRADQLRAEIRGLLSLGWKPASFTYQTTQLAYTEESIPAAQLAVDRAQRAYDQFREDARRQGVMPGWLR